MQLEAGISAQLRVGDARVSGERHAAQTAIFRLPGAHFTHQGQPVLLGEAQSADEHVVALACQAFQGCCGDLHRIHMRAPVFQGATNQLQNVVVNDEDAAVLELRFDDDIFLGRRHLARHS